MIAGLTEHVFIQLMNKQVNFTLITDQNLLSWFMVLKPNLNISIRKVHNLIPFPNPLQNLVIC